MKHVDEYRMPTRVIWQMRITTGLAALAMLALVALPFGGPAALLFYLSTKLEGPLSIVLIVVAIGFSLLLAIALFWWARTWGRMALGPWGGIGTLVGIGLSVLVVPGILWWLSEVAYEWGAWPLGAVARIAAWLWFLAALYGAWRWLKTGYQEA